MYRKEIPIYVYSVFFIASAALLHIFDERQALPFTVITLVFFLYALVILLWARHMENRVLKASVARRFKAIAILLIGYLGTRTLKYEVLIQAPPPCRGSAIFIIFSSSPSSTWSFSPPLT